MSIIIIATGFHKEIIEEMIIASQAECEKAGLNDVSLIRVSGSFETPLVVGKILAKIETEAIVVLGYIEKGETLHGEVMGNVVHDKLLDLSLKHGKPIGFGIIGPGATFEQAKVRATATAKRAVQAVVQSLKVLKEI
jgi:6,7-dimethyl-8-ribityllumazine synthase